VFCWRENLRHLGYLFVPLAAAALRPRFRTQVAAVRRREGIREGRGGCNDANCMGCHDTGIYTRKDRLVQSLDALKKRLGDCSHMANKEFSASETQNIIKYLNYQFYQFR